MISPCVGFCQLQSQTSCVIYPYVFSLQLIRCLNHDVIHSCAYPSMSMPCDSASSRCHRIDRSCLCCYQEFPQCSSVGTFTLCSLLSQHQASPCIMSLVFSHMCVSVCQYQMHTSRWKSHDASANPSIPVLQHRYADPLSRPLAAGRLRSRPNQGNLACACEPCPLSPGGSPRSDPLL